MMEKITRDLLRELQDGFKLETRPFKRIANKLGVSEEEVLKMIQDCLDQGIIRRIGAAIRPEKLGHSSNALVVWEVPAEKIDAVGEDVALMREVSHVYERDCPTGWNFNFFTMIHAHHQVELESIIQQISDRHQLKNYRIYESEKELKKISMRYFTGDDC
ncbi:MAG: Lrp/AsnC family transcriptional regulator [Candidatus Rifleibacteriota bacterium]